MKARERRRLRQAEKPQSCPHCQVSLADPSVPPEYAALAGGFTLALSLEDEWICPVCLGRWRR